MNQFIIWNDLRLFIGSHDRPVIPHHHPVVQLVVAITGTFRSKDNEGNWVSMKGLLIAPNYPHECDANHVPIVSIDIDPESNLGEWILKNQLNEHSFLPYPSELFGTIQMNEFIDLMKHQEWAAMRSAIKQLFSYEKTYETAPLDDRIQRILNFISENITGTITTEMLQEVVFLSESRMLHLFKEKMGLPIRNYILWYRLKIVLITLLNGKSLTEASYHAGFSDQAHLSRTFTRMIGIPPSLIAKNSKFVQVSFPA